MGRGMMEAEILSSLLLLTLYIAENIYFDKCMFYNVPRLSDSDKKKCIDEAVEVLPEFLEYYKKASEVLEGKGVAESKGHCLCNCDWNEACE